MMHGQQNIKSGYSWFYFKFDDMVLTAVTHNNLIPIFRVRGYGGVGWGGVLSAGINSPQDRICVYVVM
jgi:hypothetical protein